jgi:hypothetical protein
VRGEALGGRESLPLSLRYQVDPCDIAHAWRNLPERKRNVKRECAAVWFL